MADQNFRVEPGLEVGVGGTVLLASSSGNIGIGSTNPTTKLTVGGVLGFGAGNNVRIGDNTTGASLTSGISGINNVLIGTGAGSSIANGQYNVFFGYYSGRLTTSGSNVFVGRASGYSNTSGEINTFLGSYAGNYNTTGNKNTFLGTQAGTYNSSGSDNVFLGSYTGISTSASRKVVLGSGFSISELFDAPDATKDTQFAVGIKTDANPANYWLVGNENFNVGIGTTNPQTKLEIGGVLGFGAGNNVRIGDNTTGCSITTGTDNNFLGNFAGRSNINGSRNNFIGRCAGYGNTSGDNNNFFGTDAGKFSSRGCDNNFFGRYSGLCNTSGSYNNYFGFCAGFSNSSGGSNNFFGPLAGRCNTSGSQNIFIGSCSGHCNTSGANNIFLGLCAGFCAGSISDNIAIGQCAGRFIGTATQNTIVGGQAGTALTGGFGRSTFIGYQAGCNVSSGFHNISIGWCSGLGGFGNGNVVAGVVAGLNNIAGCYNTFFGSAAGCLNTVGNFNTYIGYRAGERGTTGDCNTFVGYQAGRCNTLGVFNTYVGTVAGVAQTDAGWNVYLGYAAGGGNTLLGGKNQGNTFLGSYAGSRIYIGDHNTFVGYNVGVSSAAHNKVILGAGQTSYTFDGFAPDNSKQLAIGVNTTGTSEYWITGDSQLNIGVGTHTPIEKLTVGGHIQVGIGTTLGGGKGIVLTAPNGNKFLMRINNAGVTSITAY